MKRFKLTIAAIAAFLCLASVSEACIFSRGVHRRQDRRAARHEGNAAAREAGACACGPSCACAMPANPVPQAAPAQAPAQAAAGCADGSCGTSRRGGGRRGWFFNN